MRNLLFWGLFPLVLPQALWVRKTAPRFAPAAGPESGAVGEGRPIRLIGIGDSIIAGVGASTLSRALIGETASSLAGSLDAEVRWHAVGKSGARSLDVLETFVQRLPEEPADVFIVSVGVNDVTGDGERLACGTGSDARSRSCSRVGAHRIRSDIRRSAGGSRVDEKNPAYTAECVHSQETRNALFGRQMWVYSHFYCEMDMR